MWQRIWSIGAEKDTCPGASWPIKFVPEAKLKAYEKDSAEMPLKHIFALAHQLSISPAAMVEPQEPET